MKRTLVVLFLILPGLVLGGYFGLFKTKDTKVKEYDTSLTATKMPAFTDARDVKTFQLETSDKALNVKGGTINFEKADVFSDMADDFEDRAVKKEKLAGYQGVDISSSSQGKIIIEKKIDPKQMLRVEDIGQKQGGKSKPQSIKQSLAYVDSKELNHLQAKKEVRKTRLKKRLQNRKARQAFLKSREKRGIKDTVLEKADVVEKKTMPYEQKTAKIVKKKEKLRFEDYFPKRNGEVSGPSGINVEKRSSVVQ